MKSLVAISILFCLPLAAAPATPSKAAQIVTQLYRDFAWEVVIEEPQLSEHDLIEQPKAVLGRYFDETLTTLILRDRRCVGETMEVCNLDFLPIWDSQDPAAMELKIKDGKPTGTVIVSYRRPDSDETVTMTYRLSNTPAGWRISDIKYSEGHTLLGILNGK